MTFEFRRLSNADIVGRLKHICDEEHINHEPQLLTEIANYAQGGMRDAIMALDQISKVGVSTVEGFRELMGIQDVSLDVLESVVDRRTDAGLKTIEQTFYRLGDAGGLVSDLTRMVTNLIRIKSDGEPFIPSPADMERAKRLADRLELGHLVAVIKILWDLRNRVRHVDNDQRTAMEAAYILIADAIHPTKITAAAKAEAIKNGQRKLSLDEVRKMMQTPA
jgi:DNA polymerase-3 subunit gamma/tau